MSSIKNIVELASNKCLEDVRSLIEVSLPQISLQVRNALMSDGVVINADLYEPGPDGLVVAKMAAQQRHDAPCDSQCQVPERCPLASASSPGQTVYEEEACCRNGCRQQHRQSPQS